jgi:hypothetical protein
MESHYHGMYYKHTIFYRAATSSTSSGGQEREESYMVNNDDIGRQYHRLAKNVMSLALICKQRK